MTFEQMSENLKTIKLLEKDLMRDLTKEEKEAVINKGWEEFLFGDKYLNLSEEDYKDMKSLKSIISAFYTEDEEVLEDRIKNASIGAYAVLKDIAIMFEELNDKEDKCSDDQDVELCSNPEIKREVKKEDKQIEEFVQFMQDLYDSLPKSEASWFNKMGNNIHEKLFSIYKQYRNDTQDCSNEMLGGIITDAVKDSVVEDIAARLKNGEAIKMTHDEYMEVADYLCQHENHVFITNENGIVRFTKL